MKREADYSADVKNVKSEVSYSDQTKNKPKYTASSQDLVDADAEVTF